jgi:hypothetical protein
LSGRVEKNNRKNNMANIERTGLKENSTQEIEKGIERRYN